MKNGKKIFIIQEKQLVPILENHNNYQITFFPGPVDLLEFISEEYSLPDVVITPFNYRESDDWNGPTMIEMLRKEIEELAKNKNPKIKQDKIPFIPVIMMTNLSRGASNADEVVAPFEPSDLYKSQIFLDTVDRFAHPGLSPN